MLGSRSLSYEANRTGLSGALKAQMEKPFDTSLDHIRVKAQNSFPALVWAIHRHGNYCRN
ncbi:MAG TPA: hypothetical protein DCP28_32055 [Cytophagales bacterium]|nr:hypothetical protein [Cytophagales bacterium]